MDRNENGQFAPAPKRRGRPPGRRNNKTLMKEEVIRDITQRAQNYLIHEVEAVLRAVVEKAKSGDMTAAKLVLERAIPARRSVDETTAGKTAIQINIVGADDHGNNQGRIPPITYVTAADPEGQARGGPQGGEVESEHGGEEGQRSH